MAKCHQNRKQKHKRSQKHKLRRLSLIHDMKVIQKSSNDTKLINIISWSLKNLADYPNVMPPNLRKTKETP